MAYTALRCIEPVSYTHLDVYKRQALQDIQPGSPPRKGEPAYAAVVAPMLQAARMLSSPAALQLSLIHI